jgi:hypothetical protein
LWSVTSVELGIIVVIVAVAAAAVCCLVLRLGTPCLDAMTRPGTWSEGGRGCLQRRPLSLRFTQRAWDNGAQS